jgi:plasmid maintenance system antidote protein VapI
MQRVAFNVGLMLEDMAVKGLTASDVAALTKPPVAKSSVTRFLNGQHQTPRMAKLIARALGYTTARRYIVSESHQPTAVAS